MTNSKSRKMRYMAKITEITLVTTTKMNFLMMKLAMYTELQNSAPQKHFDG